MLRKYLFKQRTFMTTLVLSLVFYVLLMPFSAVLAANDSYVNVNRDGWTFYLDGDRIIATNGTQYAFFNDAPENEKDVDKRFNQKKDFFKQQGEAFSCGSHIDRIKTETVNRGKTETKISYKLYEEGNGGPGCGQNTGYTIGDIKVEDSVPANVKKTAAAFNYGNEPRGCPGSADIPNNANKK
ncbi:MAG TPA: hypothetical protein PKV52_04710, partial [Candidatus Saccharibacteria bacterium]|nr:hypothetical protein [Candidatus Saccharibacteria bacterium]